MKRDKAIARLSVIIALAAGAAASVGIFSSGGPGPHLHETVRGTTVTIYGQGLYKHMSAEVAPQGIAQDYITLFVAVPELLASLLFAVRGSLKARFILAGTLGYFLVTYLFYLMMGMYNAMFLVYAVLLSSSFFALFLTLMSFDPTELPERFGSKAPAGFAGGFLILNAAAIAFLWLGVVVPPLMDGSIIPKEVEHYTTLVVQGLDLGLLLPIAVVSGILLKRRSPFGYLFAPVYLVFLSILMIALTAKLVAMASLGFSVIPAIFIIPTLAVVSITCSAMLLKQLNQYREMEHREPRRS
ncbi:MAG: hypothetical protein HRF44_03715 [Ignavibacterium sp.]|jgi:hypothetical protein